MVDTVYLYIAKYLSSHLLFAVTRLRRIETQLDKIKDVGEAEKMALKEQASKFEEKIKEFSVREEQWVQTKQKLEAALKDVQGKIDAKDNKIVDLIMTVKQLNDLISGLETQKAALEAEAVQHTLLRRKLHNEIQELKGLLIINSSNSKGLLID